jgi:hypothetical protein
MSHGQAVWWRFKGDKEWRPAWVYHGPNMPTDMRRMGLYNGDDSRGPVVTVSEIEWRPQ